MATTLETGLNFIINQRVAGVNTPLYPFTKTSNVVDESGNNIDEIIAGLAKAEHGNHVPTVEETASNLRFLRNDNTWGQVQAASTEQAGVVQLSDSTSLSDSTVAATAKAVATLKNEIDSIAGVSDKYIEKTQIGVASGVASLDKNGMVPSSQLPGYVDDVVDVTMNAELTSATDAEGTEITPESGKIYIDAIGDEATNKTYRWSGTRYVLIADSLALGETSATAFDGARGLVAYEHSQSKHARVDATAVAASENNGYVNINGTDTLVYTHPTVEGASETNPHGTTKADVGLTNVEDKSAAEILDEIDATLITTKLGYTPQNAATLASKDNSGVMSAAYASKLENCLQAEVTSGEPTITDGLVFKIIS